MEMCENYGIFILHLPLVAISFQYVKVHSE